MFGSVAVVIDVVPAVEERLADAVVESCDAALGPGSCQLADGTIGEAKWRAVVRWRGGQLEVARVDFVRNQGPGTPLVSRELTFTAYDAPRDRWASVGVLVAALVASQRQRAAAPAAPVAPPPATSPRDDVQSFRSTHVGGTGPTLRLDLRALLARRLERGTVALGGIARGSVKLEAPVFFTGALGYAARPSTEPHVSWLSGSMGFGVQIGPPRGRVATEVRGEAAVEQWFIRASEPGRTERDSVTRFGSRLGVDLVWALWPAWQLVTGGEVSVLGPEIVVDVAGATIETVPAFGWALTLGLRFSP